MENDLMATSQFEGLNEWVSQRIQWYGRVYVPRKIQEVVYWVVCWMKKVHWRENTVSILSACLKSVLLLSVAKFWLKSLIENNQEWNTRENRAHSNGGNSSSGVSTIHHETSAFAGKTANGFFRVDGFWVSHI